MPDVHDFLEEAVGYEHYCSFDMAKMFTQFRIKESDKYCWTIIKIPIKGGYSQAHEYVCITLLDDDKVIGTCRVKYSTLIQGGSVKKVDHVKTISQVIDTFG